ncbi:MAG: hypothetical protein ACI915_002429 [Gammaproteobacteria bacterium]|jgi:hypothetical protein
MPRAAGAINQRLKSGPATIRCLDKNPRIAPLGNDIDYFSGSPQSSEVFEFQLSD